MRHPKAAPDLVDNVDAAKLLVEISDADVNCVNENGDTPLTLAIACKLDSITRYLITLPDIGLGEPQPGLPTPVALAMKHNRLDVASLIISTQVWFVYYA
jgi:ankyrin repeat protein